MEVTSRFLYRGTYTDYENTFQRKVETPVEVHLLHENRENNRIISVGGLEEWVVDGF